MSTKNNLFCVKNKMSKKSQTVNKFETLAKNLKHEMKKEAWYWHVINLAWTAGPVTFIAVYISYYIGYGKFTSIKTIIYFGMYTVFAGLFAIIFQAVKNAAVNAQIDKYTYQLNFIIDKYLEYISFCKESQIFQFPEKQRDLMSAWWVLTSSNSDIDMIQHAVYLATKRKDLAEAIQKIEFYRKQGFNQQLMNEYLKIEGKLEKCLEKMEPVFPTLANTIRERFQGKAKNTKQGMERPQGFLSRLMRFVDDDIEYSDEYTRFEDIIALFNFVIELVLNRKILVIEPDFKHNKEFDKLIHEYEAKISDFKLIRRQRNNKTREMIDVINESLPHEKFKTMGANSAQLNDILAELKFSHKYKKLIKSKQIKENYIDFINLKNKKLKSIISRLRQIYSKKLSKTDISKLDIDIKEDFIFLEDKEKIEVVKLLFDVINKNQAEPSNIENIKKICIETLNILDESLNISEPDNQIAVEESMATDLNVVEPNFTTRYKIDMIVNQINEQQHSKTRTIHRFVRHLVQYYNIEISEELKQKIIVEYQAEEDCLDALLDPIANINSISLDNLEREIFTVLI